MIKEYIVKEGIYLEGNFHQFYRSDDVLLQIRVPRHLYQQNLSWLHGKTVKLQLCEVSDSDAPDSVNKTKCYEYISSVL